MNRFLRADTAGRPPLAALDHLALLFLGMYTVSCFFPPLRALPGYTWWGLLALAGWLACAFAQKPDFFLVLPVRRLTALLFVLYTALVPYLFGTGTLGNRYASLAFLAVGYMVYEYYSAVGKPAAIRRLTAVTLLFAGVTCVRTLWGLLDNAYLSRSLKSEGDYTIALWRQGYGGYELIYAAVLLALLALCLAVSRRVVGRGWSAGAWGAYALLCVVIVASNYFTALLLLVIGSALVLLLCWARRLNSRQCIWLVLCTVVVLLVCLLWGQALLDALVDALAALSPDGRTAARLQDMRGGLLRGIVEEFTVDRWPTLQASLQTWWQHPLMGIGVDPSLFRGNTFAVVGQHSHILDTFAFYGTLVGVVNLYVLFAPLYACWRRTRQTMVLAPFALVYGLLLLLNNATPSLALAAYILLPCVCDRLRESAPELAPQRPGRARIRRSL